MKCPKCQTNNSDSAKFCGVCGQALVVKTTCTRCQHENPEGFKFCEECGQPLTSPQTSSTPSPAPIPPPLPASFANGRYQVKKFLGEGGKKKVYLAHDSVLDRDVAFALIKTEKLDETALTRIRREAQAMGKLGDHPNIMSIFDMGEHQGQPYIVIPLMPGGDVEKLIEKASDHKLSLDKAIDITKCVCRGLEFAHGKGIIHRDLKPGNVWLSADGTAKIGDFGLAVAIDMSRLTGAGMMVGTVSYMPPEQAMGGQVTAKADLYSLGAMLYEMVTGRPPFVGDESVAIIGQHINTPPVSPTWHRADLPPSLETLIMQLLEKDPEKRPQSATVVLQALETIGSLAAEYTRTKGPSTKDTSTKDPMTKPYTENPLYRRVFVGREAELKQLQSAFDGAMSGQGALMMVMGEPGIGKTALCEQLSTYVTLRGGRTLVGHCYEEGSLSLPYLAFVEAMRSYVLAREVKELRAELGTGATDVARIVSEIRERLKVRLRPQKDPEEERYRLMQAVTSFLTNAAAVQPLVVVLEDLHDADKGTLDMLTHVSRNLAKARLLIVGTYRDVEVDRNHPLSAALADLRRVSTYGRVLLRGLNADEVRRMLESITRESVPWGLAEAVHRQTEGNPLFVQEVIRFLAEEGLLVQKDGHWRPGKDAPLEMNIPEGLRDVIGKRLSLLTRECNEMLSVASVIGREFAMETLKAVAAAGMNDDAFVNGLKEAVHLSVLEERSQLGAVRYRFAHAFFRQTLYEEMIAPQRLKLHQQVARALETLYAKRLDEHATELAEHFSQSTDPADLKKAVEYGEMAAKRATDVYAYGEAVRLLEQANKVQKVLDPGDRAKMCDLLLELCEALYHTGDHIRIADVESPAAFSLAELVGDASRASRACVAAFNAMVWNTMNHGSPQFAEWAARADRYARPNTIERALADIHMAVLVAGKGDIGSAYGLAARAHDLAHRLGDHDAARLTAYGLIQFRRAPQHFADRLQAAEEELSDLRTVVTVQNATILAWVADAFLCAGHRQRADEAIAKLADLAEKSGEFHLGLVSRGLSAVMEFMEGHLEESLDMAVRLRGLAEQSADMRTEGEIGAWAAFSEPRTRICLGDPLEALETRYLKFAPNNPITRVVQAYLGRREEVSRVLERQVVMRPGIGTAEDETPASSDTFFLEASVIVGHRRAAELLLDRLSGHGLATTGFWYPTCVPRHLGGAAALLGRHDEARKHYLDAIRVCTEMRFRPELALTRLQLAELLLEHYPDEKKDALEHLDFAIKEFREMKMRPSLERALRHKEILKA